MGRIAPDDRRRRHVRRGEEREALFAVEANDARRAAGAGEEVPAQAAGEVGDGQAERLQAGGPPLRDQRVRHHFQSLPGVHKPPVVAEALAGTLPQHHLLGESARLFRGERAPHKRGQLMEWQLRQCRGEPGQRIAAAFRGQEPRALKVHPASVPVKRRRGGYPSPVAAILCLDFDDTVVLDNTARQVFERFCAPRWHDFEAAYNRREITLEQYNAAAVDLIEAPRDEIEAFVRTVARPRPGIMELVDWATWHDWLVTVVSYGFDLYVDPVLDDLGLRRVARHCGRTRQGYRWRVNYLSPRGVVVEDGFKLAYAAAFKAAGDFVAYAGDGASDVAAARLAPAVFARDTLWARLKDEHPRIHPFETFHDVVTVLERDAEGWLATFAGA